MTNRSFDNDDCAIEVDENVMPGTRSRNEADDLQYRLASERNRRRWEYEEMYEKDAIETYINEDAATKERRSICQAVKMSEIVLNIQEALHSGSEHDLPKAIENLNKLLKEPFTTMSLLYAPSVVKTVYLCCRYTKSNEVRAVAEKCYKRFEPCFGVPYGESFETAFQSEVREFWETQNTVTYDTTKYDWRQFTMDDEDPSTEIENGPEGETSQQMEVDFVSNRNDSKIKIENIKVKTEVDDESTVKREIKQEITDDKNLIQKITVVKTESPDDKSQVKKEIKVECKVETDNMQDDCKVSIKNDLDDIEITYCHVKLESDFRKLNAEYDSDNDCYIIN